MSVNLEQAREQMFIIARNAFLTGVRFANPDVGVVDAERGAAEFIEALRAIQDVQPDPMTPKSKLHLLS